MSDNEKFDLRDKIILHGNQGVNGEYLRHSLRTYLNLSRGDFKKIEEKPQSSLSLRELRLLVGRNILSHIHTYLEETNQNQVINNFLLYLFQVWFDETISDSHLGERRGISLIPYVPFKDREDILMSTLCRTVLFSFPIPREGVGRQLVHSKFPMGGWILSDDLWKWVGRMLEDIEIPERKGLRKRLNLEGVRSFYLFGRMNSLNEINQELNDETNRNLSSFIDDSTTAGLRISYNTKGYFDKESGCLEWEVKEEPSIKGKFGQKISSLLRPWVGLESPEPDFSMWLRSSMFAFDPFSFNESRYKDRLKHWL